jgi:K+-transporting ATPase ATPase C chain
MTILKDIKTSLIITAVFAVVCCGAYPLVVWGGSQLLFKKQADGSLLYDKQGNLVGSSLLGQNFNGAQYFNPRPSAAGAAGYDASASSGTNLGPTNQKLIDAVKQRVADYRKANGLADSAPVPADAVTSSASGLDPHISVANALLQVPRVAAQRKIGEDKLKELVEAHTDHAVLGDDGVNVVTLNLALDGVLP